MEKETVAGLLRVINVIPAKAGMMIEPSPQRRIVYIQ